MPPRVSLTPMGRFPYLRPRNAAGLVNTKLKYTNAKLTKLPIELRMVIYELALIRKHRKTPNLLKALRADDTGLYDEAIEVYYKINTFELSWDDARNPGTMTWFDLLKPEIKKMVKGGISISVPLYHLSASITIDPRNIARRAFIITQHAALLQLPNITSLQFIAANPYSLYNTDIDIFFFAAQLDHPDNFHKLKSLEIVIGKLKGVAADGPTMALADTITTRMRLELTCSFLGSCFKEEGHKKHDKWTWTAKEGGAIECSVRGFFMGKGLAYGVGPLKSL